METRYKPAPCQNFIYRINALTRQCWSHLRVECWLFVWTFYSYTVTKPGKKSAKINTAAAKKEQNHSFIKPQWAMKWTFKKKLSATFYQGLKFSGSMPDLSHRAVLNSDLIQYIVQMSCQEKFPGSQIFLALFHVLLCLLFPSCL